MKFILSICCLSLLVFLSWSCSSQKESKNANSEAAERTESEEFEPYVITDSSRIQTFTSGLQVYVVKEGPGDYPRQGMNLVVDYHGMLDDGSVFDSSYDRAEPLSFTLGETRMITGWDEAMLNLRLGTKAVLIIPPKLGFGARGREPNIPGNSTLVYHVNLLGSF